jgi:hypothetical protein
MASSFFKFPSDGGGLGVPRLTGTVVLSEVTRLIDDRWARKAADQAAARPPGTATVGCAVQGLLGSGLLGQTGASALLGGSRSLSGANLGSLTKIFQSLGKSTSGNSGKVAIGTAVLALAAGSAKSSSGTSGALLKLLDKYASTKDPSLLALASKLSARSADNAGTFGEAFKLASQGRLGAGSPGLGDALSGVSGQTARTFGQTGPLASLTAEDEVLRFLLEAQGVSAPLPPAVSLAELEKTQPSVKVAEGDGKGFASELSKMLDDMKDSISKYFKKDDTGHFEVLTADLAGDGGFDFFNFSQRAPGSAFVDGKTGTTAVKPAAPPIATAKDEKAKKVDGLATLGSIFGLVKSLGFNTSGYDSVASILGGTTSIGSLVAPNSGLASSIVNSLSDSCAFSKSMAELMARVAAGEKLSTSELDQLMALLECRRSGYSDAGATAQDAADAAARALAAMLGLNALFDKTFGTNCLVRALLPGDCK